MSSADSSPSYYLACDLGAESGRVMLGTLCGGRVELEELHRFPSAVVRIGGTMRWDVLRIFDEIKAGMRVAAARGVRIESVSTDSWGVDYVWMREGEPCVGVPFHYRDVRTDNGFERVFAKVPKDVVFERTGIQLMTLNSLFQFEDDVRNRRWIFDAGCGFLNIADWVNHQLGGEAVAEETLASTTQIYDTRDNCWAEDLAEAIGLPVSVFPPVVSPGSVTGELAEAIVGEVGLEGVRVVAGCSHDTGAAVVAVPAEGKGWAFLSSGTWSLLGVELPAPVINDRVCELNFTNEAGYGGTTRFMKNISGLWVVQECRRLWAEQGQPYDYSSLNEMAAREEPLRSLINPFAPQFAKPGDMPARIAEFCRETGQPVPQSPGAYVRCALESLALVYRKTLGELEEVSGRTIDRIHIVGGGSRSDLLNSFAAHATGRRVYAGPAEATATGNVLVQAMALGHIFDLAAARDIVRKSTEIRMYEPQSLPAWSEAAARFEALPSQ
jgi:rhamnulokinase